MDPVDSESSKLSTYSSVITCHRSSSLLVSEPKQLVSHCLYRKWYLCDFWWRQLLDILVKIIWKVFSISRAFGNAQNEQQSSEAPLGQFLNKSGLWSVLSLHWLTYTLLQCLSLVSHHSVPIIIFDWDWWVRVLCNADHGVPNTGRSE